MTPSPRSSSSPASGRTCTSSCRRATCSATRPSKPSPHDSTTTATHAIVTRVNDGTGPSLFCVPGAADTPLQYRQLGRRLDDVAVWAFSYRGIEHHAIPDQSVAAIARRNVRALRTADPIGPYRLLGYSFGGMVALEMAAQLTADGGDVELLVLLEPSLGKAWAAADAPPAEARALREHRDQREQREQRHDRGGVVPHPGAPQRGRCPSRHGPVGLPRSARVHGAGGRPLRAPTRVHRERGDPAPQRPRAARGVPLLPRPPRAATDPRVTPDAPSCSPPPPYFSLAVDALDRVLPSESSGGSSRATSWSQASTSISCASPTWPRSPGRSTCSSRLNRLPRPLPSSTPGCSPSTRYSVPSANCPTSANFMMRASSSVVANSFG